MSYTRTAIATAIIAISLFAAGPGTQPATASGGLAEHVAQRVAAASLALQAPENVVAPTYTTAIHAENDGQQATAQWALDQMAAAGFELPPVTIHMHADRHDCSNEPGGVSNGYFTQSLGENIVHSCGSPWVLIHELAHVWDKTTMDDAMRDYVLDAQGLETWNSDTWIHAGGEHFASIVAWAIEGTHPSSIGYYTNTHLAEVYRAVTGREPPTLSRDGSPAASSVVVVSTATLPTQSPS
jgi:hypothetical protein